MTTAFRNVLAVCSVATCGGFYNPTVAGHDAAGRCGVCRKRNAKAAVRIEYVGGIAMAVSGDRPSQAAAQPKPAPARPTTWADESNGVCNRCKGTGIFKWTTGSGDCFRCGGSGVAPGTQGQRARAVMPAETEAVFEEVVLDFTPVPEALYITREDIILARAAFMVSRRKGLTKATGWHVQTPSFARRPDGGFDVIPF